MMELQDMTGLPYMLITYCVDPEYGYRKVEKIIAAKDTDGMYDAV